MDLVPFLASMNLFSLRVGRENQEANAGFSLVGGGKYKPWNTYKSTHFYPIAHNLPSSWLWDPLYWIGTERFISVATVSRGNGGGRRVGRHKYLFAFEPLFSRLCLSSRINFFFLVVKVLKDVCTEQLDIKSSFGSPTGEPVLLVPQGTFPYLPKLPSYPPFSFIFLCPSSTVGLNPGVSRITWRAFSGPTHRISDSLRLSETWESEFS